MNKAGCFIKQRELMDQNLENSKELALLRKQLQDERAMNWIFGEVIKISGRLESLEHIMNIITDILMGIMGLDTCTIWIREEQEYIYYSRSIYNNNTFMVEKSRELPDYLLRLKEAALFNVENIAQPFLKGKNVKSAFLAPLENYKTGERIGIIVAEHKSMDYFTDTKIDFFKILSIQISIAVQNAKLFDKVNELTNKDALTNCYNRKYLNKLMFNMNKDKKDYSMIVFDLDNFKSVNDVYGHEKGDILLVKIASLALDRTQSVGGDVIRYGGDEFIIILHQRLEFAVKFMEKLKSDMHELDILKAIDVKVGMSIGIASYPQTVSDMENIFRIADEALLEAKAEGKDTIRVGYEENNKNQI